MDVPLWAWLAVLAVIVAMLAVDLFAHRTAHVVSVREAAVWSTIWVTLGFAFGGVVWWAYGAQAGGEYFAGYLIEKSLAVDNVFVFALIFTYFAVPREYQHRVLFYGVLGALAFRAIFIAGGAVLIENFAWILYLFGAFLVYTGWKMFAHRNSEMDPSKNPVLRFVRRRVPSTDEYHGQKFWHRSRNECRSRGAGLYEAGQHPEIRRLLPRAQRLSARQSRVRSGHPGHSRFARSAG